MLTLGHEKFRVVHLTDLFRQSRREQGVVLDDEAGHDGHVDLETVRLDQVTHETIRMEMIIANRLYTD